MLSMQQHQSDAASSTTQANPSSVGHHHHHLLMSYHHQHQQDRSHEHLHHSITTSEHFHTAQAQQFNQTTQMDHQSAAHYQHQPQDNRTIIGPDESVQQYYSYAPNHQYQASQYQPQQLVEQANAPAILIPPEYRGYQQYDRQHYNQHQSPTSVVMGAENQRRVQSSYESGTQNYPGVFLQTRQSSSNFQNQMRSESTNHYSNLLSVATASQRADYVQSELQLSKAIRSVDEDIDQSNRLKTNQLSVGASNDFDKSQIDDDDFVCDRWVSLNKT